jgi:LysR family transcriptional regulator, hydrogen peroxide-inducible genes activator
MEIYQLRYFVAVAEAGNFTAAARRSNISQPSLSQQIKNLEDELGHRLFDRLGRRAQLTDPGRAFLERTRRILQEVDDAARAVRESSGGGTVRFGVIPSVAPYLLPDLMPRIRERLPDTRVEVLEDFRSYLIEQVLAGKLDAAIVTMPPDTPKLTIEPLFSEPLLAVMPDKHKLAHKIDLSSSDLEGERLVLLGDSSSLALQTQRFFGDNRVHVEVSCRCAQVKTVKALVAAGLGIAVLPKMAAGRDGIPGLVYRELSDPGPRRELVLVRHQQRFHSRAEETFRTLVQECCTERYGPPPAIIPAASPR